MTAPAAERLAVTLAYSPHKPTPPQHAFLLLDELLGNDLPSEALYGGAAGGGKSDALIMAALRYVHVPRYGALLLRRTFADLELQDALIPRSLEWLSGTGAVYDGSRFRWTFPGSNAVLQFGYLATEQHKYRYQGSAWQFIGVDEATQIPMRDIRYLLSRMRRPSGISDDDPLSRVPLRLRLASNPGGVSHDAILARYVEGRVDEDDPEDTEERARRRVFIPARLDDNPHIDRTAYLASLAGLDNVTRQQLRDGNWYVDTGDRIYPPNGISAALSIGAELDALADESRQPPPDGEAISVGIDWGEHAWHVIGYPLEGGGLYIVGAQPHIGLEPGTTTERVLDSLGDVPAWEGLGRVEDPIDLLSDARYDAAGVQSMRTFAKIARRRRGRLPLTKVPFGNYKREAIGYLRHLFERAEEGHATRVIAISNRPEVDRLFVKQLRHLTKDPADGELPLKPDRDAPEEERDDGPDALVALAAPIARRFRARGATRRKRAA